MQTKRFSRRACLGQVAAGGIATTAATASMDKSAVAEEASKPLIKIAPAQFADGLQ